MKAVVILLLMTGWVIPGAYAQTGQQDDVVYMQDGTVWQGQLRTTSDGEPYAISLFGGSLVRVNPINIDSVRKVPAFDIRSLRPLITKTEGLFNTTYGGWMFGSQPNNGYGYGNQVGGLLHNVTGYYLHPAIGIGIGAGIDHYSSGLALITPLYLHLEGMPWSGQIVPFYAVEGGYGFSWDTDQQTEWYSREESGGTFWMMGVGLRFFTRNRAYYNLQVGIRQQQRTISEWYAWNESSQVTALTHSRLQVTFGIGF